MRIIKPISQDYCVYNLSKIIFVKVLCNLQSTVIRTPLVVSREADLVLKKQEVELPSSSSLGAPSPWFPGRFAQSLVQQEAWVNAGRQASHQRDRRCISTHGDNV